MTRRPGMWTPQDVTCAECGAALKRRVWRFKNNDVSSPPVPIERFFCNTKCKGEWQKRETSTAPDAEWLRKKYVVEGLDCVEIGRIVNRDPKTVWLWLRHAGIVTRGRGTDPRYQYKKGQPGTFTGRRHTPEARAKVRAATIARGGVPYLKNGVHHLKGKRGAEVPNWKGGVTPERQEFYRSQEWKAACRAVWYRADARCERCGKDHRKRAAGDPKFHVHHIVSFAFRELRAEVSNLALLCQPCHSWVHSSENTLKCFLGEGPFDSAALRNGREMAG